MGKKGETCFLEEVNEDIVRPQGNTVSFSASKHLLSPCFIEAQLYHEIPETPRPDSFECLESTGTIERQRKEWGAIWLKVPITWFLKVFRLKEHLDPKGFLKVAV